MANKRTSTVRKVRLFSILLATVVAVGVFYLLRSHQEKLNIGPFDAIRQHDTDSVTRLLQQGADANCSIDISVYHDFLIRIVGPIVFPHRPRIQYALGLAVKEGQPDVCDILIDHGADINRPSVFWANGGDDDVAMRPLEIAIDNDDVVLVERLLVRGANTDISSEDGESPIGIAARHDQTAIVALIAKHAANSERHMNLHTAR